MHPFALIAQNRAEARDWIAEHFPDTSGWFVILTPRTKHDGELFLAAYATPQARERYNELEMGRLFKYAARAISAAHAASPSWDLI